MFSFTSVAVLLLSLLIYMINHHQNWHSGPGSTLKRKLGEVVCCLGIHIRDDCRERVVAISQSTKLYLQHLLDYIRHPTSLVTKTGQTLQSEIVSSSTTTVELAQAYSFGGSESRFRGVHFSNCLRSACTFKVNTCAHAYHSSVC